MRTWIQSWHQSRIKQLAKRSNLNQLKRSAVVFSPHQDDEVLGCGGTLLHKQQAGAAIKIVFMTDGSESHSQLISPETLANLRQKEAIAAAQHIGLSQSDVLFLGLKDGQLSNRSNQIMAIEQVTAILHQHQPEEIYIPYYLEPHPDHVATHTAVMGALQNYGRSVMVYEYPVWFWNCWPWVRFTSRDWRDYVNQLKWVVKSNLRLTQDFHHVVYIADVLKDKRTALEQHQSQVQRLLPQPEWVVLEDMAEGDFLRCLFQNHEIFYGHRFPQNHS